MFDFLESEGYIRLKADASISSKELYEAYQIYCAENNLTTMKPRSFSDAVIASQGKYNLEYCNNVTNAAGRRVRGFFGIEALVHPNISVFSGDSLAYVRTERRTGRVAGLNRCTYVRNIWPCYLIYCRRASRPKVVVPILGTTRTMQISSAWLKL